MKKATLLQVLEFIYNRDVVTPFDLMNWWSEPLRLDTGGLEDLAGSSAL